MRAATLPAGADGTWQHYPPDDPFAGRVGPLFKMYRNDPAEPVRLGFLITPEHCNPMGACHGGMLATMLDLGLGIVGLTVAGATNRSPTIQMSLDFLAAATLGEWVESRCRLVHATGRLLFTEGTLVTSAAAVVRGNAIYQRGR